MSISIVFFYFFFQYFELKILLSVYDKGVAQTQLKEGLTIFKDGKLLMLLLGCDLVFLVAVVLGLVAFIIPGIYLYVTLQFAAYFVLEYRTPVLQAFRNSEKITKHFFWHVMVITGIRFLICNTSIYFVPIIARIPLLGLLSTLANLAISFFVTPIANLMMIYTYKKLNEVRNGIKPPVVD